MSEKKFFVLNIPSPENYKLGTASPFCQLTARYLNQHTIDKIFKVNFCNMYGFRFKLFNRKRKPYMLQLLQNTLITEETNQLQKNLFRVISQMLNVRSGEQDGAGNILTKGLAH